MTLFDGLWVKPHSTHFSFEQAIAVAARLRPRHTWLTHMTHDMSHEDIKAYIRNVLKPSLAVEPAYDGLVLDA